MTFDQFVIGPRFSLYQNSFLNASEIVITVSGSELVMVDGDLKNYEK